MGSQLTYLIENTAYTVLIHAEDNNFQKTDVFTEI